MTRVGTTWLLTVGLALAGCKGSSVDQELANSGEATEETTDEATEEAATAAEEATTPAIVEPSDGETAVYGETAVHVGDRVRLIRRVGLLTAPGLKAGQQVEAAAGRAGEVTAIRDPAGVIDVTWDAQDWTIHGGYNWSDQETLEVADVENTASKSAGTVTLQPFTTSVHMGYVEVVSE